MRSNPIGAGLVLLLWSACAAGTLGHAVQTAAPSAPDEAKAAPATQADSPKLNEKQKALVYQADKLLAMATELKEQVDRTNKNILSVKVVTKAEEIEQYARQLKGQAKR